MKMTKERIEITRQSLIPFVKKVLLEINHEGLGKSDAEEFEKDINEILDLSIKSLEQQSSDDCVSREAIFETIDDCNSDGLKGIFCSYADGERFKEYIKKLPPVTPTFPKVGKWIGEEEGYYSECSCCGASFLWEDYKYLGDWKYCPKCGADMRGNEND